MSEENYKTFCKYFDLLEEKGISFGIMDLIKKARELGLPPCSKTIEDLVENVKKKKCQ